MFIISLSNRDAALHSVANVLRLDATPASGTAVIVRWGGVREDSSIPGAADVVVLAPEAIRDTDPLATGHRRSNLRSTGPVARPVFNK